MKKIYTLALATSLATLAQAQTLQLVNSQFLTNGIVDAAKQDVYTYTNISTNTIPPATNFDIKKFNTTTNQFDLVHSFPNSLLFVNHQVATVVNKKFLIGADYKGPNSFSISGRNIYVFNGVNTYDSLFSKTDSVGLGAFYTDVLSESVYFSVTGKASKAGVYLSDFTKGGTVRIMNNPAGKLMGLGSAIYMNEQKIVNGFQLKNYLTKYENTVVTMVDSSTQLYNDFYKDETNNELYFAATNNFNRIIRKIAANGTITLLDTVKQPTTIGRLFGKIGNKLLFTSTTNTGLVTFDVVTKQVSSVFATGITNQPAGFSSANYVAATLNGNYIYFKTQDPSTSLNKIWVTNGTSITKADSTVYAGPNYALSVGNNFCGDNMINVDYVTYNNVAVVTTTPTGAISKQCTVSSVPTWSCFTTGQFTTKTALYVIAGNNTYKAASCATSTALNTLNTTALNLYPNPTSNTIIIDGVDVNTTYIILNTLGQVVKTITSCYTTTTIDVSTLTNGLYIIKASNGAVSKFIKE